MQLSVSHMPVHVIDFQLRLEIFNYNYQLVNMWPSSITITITITFQICNRLQLQIKITTSLFASPVLICEMYFCFLS